MKIDIEVIREPTEKDWTLSEFFINRTKKGVGVEDEKRDVKVYGETRIQNGVYEIELVYSPKFSHEYYVDANGFLSEKKDKRFNTIHSLIHVKDVKNFSRILWHWGNTDLDTHGCYIVGSQFGTIKGRKGVVQSRLKYKEVYPIIFDLIRKNAAKNLRTFVEYKDK